MLKEKLLEIYTEHFGGLIGAFIGLLIAVVFLVLGFFKTMFILILAGLGYYLGKRIYEDRNYLKNLLDRILPPGTYR